MYLLKRNKIHTPAWVETRTRLVTNCNRLFAWECGMGLLKVELNPNIQMLSGDGEDQEDITVKIWAKLDYPF